jgi:MYND finger
MPWFVTKRRWLMKIAPRHCIWAPSKARLLPVAERTSIAPIAPGSFLDFPRASYAHLREIMAGFDSSVPRCNQCHSLRRNEQLTGCPKCKLVRYCNEDHQALDWPNHGAACSRIQNAKGLVDEEEAKLSGANGPSGPFIPGTVNLFETAVGRFWVIP